MSANLKKDIVVILSRFPYPLEKGDKLRAFFQIKELSNSFNVHLICISEFKPDAESITELSKYCINIDVHVLPKWKSLFSCLIALFSGTPLQIAYFRNYSIKRKIEKKLNDLKPHHIFCQLIRVAEYVKNYHDCSKTLDYMDAFSTGIERRIAVEPFYLKWIFKLEYRRLSEYERLIYDYFEFHSIISEQDKKLIGTRPSQHLECIPNGVSDSFFENIEKPDSHYDLVFVGNLNYPPNVEAVKYIVNEILPHAEGKGLKLTFLAAGAEPAKALIALQHKTKRFEILANCKDIRKAYLSGNIFLAPMKIGTGLQNKLLEAMALGIPSITTQLANNALKAKPDVSILISETPEGFVNQILQLKDQEFYDLISSNGKNYIKENFNWTIVTQPLIEAIKNV